MPTFCFRKFVAVWEFKNATLDTDGGGRGITAPYSHRWLTLRMATANTKGLFHCFSPDWFVCLEHFSPGQRLGPATSLTAPESMVSLTGNQNTLKEKTGLQRRRKSTGKTRATPSWGVLYKGHHPGAGGSRNWSKNVPALREQEEEQR